MEWDEIGGLSVKAPFLKRTVACLRRWLPAAPPLPVRAHRTPRARGGHLVLFRLQSGRACVS